MLYFAVTFSLLHLFDCPPPTTTYSSSPLPNHPLFNFCLLFPASDESSIPDCLSYILPSHLSVLTLPALFVCLPLSKSHLFFIRIALYLHSVVQQMHLCYAVSWLRAIGQWHVGFICSCWLILSIRFCLMTKWLFEKNVSPLCYIYICIACL